MADAMGMNLRKQKGTTLIELLVAIFIGMMLLVFVTQFFASQNRAYESQVERAMISQELRAIVDFVSRELRMAGYDPTASKKFDGIIYDTKKLSLIADLNADGDTADADEQIDYYIDKYGNLVRESRVAGGSTRVETLIEKMGEFTFEFFDGDGKQVISLAKQADIRQIRMVFKIKSQRKVGMIAEDKGEQAATLEVTVAPPNLAL